MRKRTVGLASIPSREGSMIRVVRSLADQVDEVLVALNGYDKIPHALQEMRNVKCELLDNSFGDAAKFYHVQDVDGLYFSADDDLEYPRDYVAYMTSKVKKYNAIITLHGRRYDRRPITSFRRGFSLNFHCLHSYAYDTELDVGGTGVMAFDTARFRLAITDFPVPNMADVWVAKKAHEQGVPIIGVAHTNRYLTYLSPGEDTIWAKSKDDSLHTSVLRGFLK